MDELMGYPVTLIALAIVLFSGGFIKFGIEQLRDKDVFMAGFALGLGTVCAAAALTLFLLAAQLLGWLK